MAWSPRRREIRCISASILPQAMRLSLRDGGTYGAIDEMEETDREERFEDAEVTSESLLWPRLRAGNPRGEGVLAEPWMPL